jgi:hypothetical protein
MHSHSLHAVMATMLDPQSSEFKVTHLEMIKVRASLSLSYGSEPHVGSFACLCTPGTGGSLSSSSRVV